jgi:hypothetical protein
MHAIGLLTATNTLPLMVGSPRGQPLYRRIRWRRVGMGALALAASMALLCFVALNVFLRTRLLRHALSGDPSTLWVDYESAYSVVPGYVHVTGLVIRGRERTEEWILTIDHVDFHVAFRDLLRHRFHVTRVHASGLGMRARMRISAADATPDVVAALPSISGFEDVPLEPPGPPPPPLTDANYNLWSVALDDVTVEHVREVWIHTVRGEGDMRVRGRWVFRPMRWLDVGPATVEVASVDVSHGVRPIVTGLHGSFEATIHPFDVRTAEDLNFFDHISTQMRLSGVLQMASALTALTPASDVLYARGEGPLDAHVVVDHGKLEPGTRISVEAPDFEVDARDLTLDASARAELDVEQEPGSGEEWAAIHAHVSDTRVWRRGIEQARAGAIDAALRTRHLDIAYVFDDALFAVDVRHAETSDIHEWRRFVPSAPEVVVHSGLVVADGHVDGSLPERHLQGEGKIVANGLVVGLGRASVAGGIVAHVALKRWAWASRSLDLSGSEVAFEDVSAGSGGRGPTTDAFVVPLITVAVPRLTIAPSGLKGRASLDFARAVVRLSRMHELVVLPAGLEVDGGEAKAGLHAELDLGSGLMSGHSDIFARGVRVKLGSTAIFGDAAIHVKARTDHAGASTDFSGSSLAITHAETGDAPAQAAGAWWGTVRLEDAVLRTGGGVTFGTKIHLTAKDATPATVLVSQNAGVPAWAADVFRMAVLDATADLRFRGSSIEVQSLVAHGGDKSIRMEYAIRDARTEGALLADLGWIQFGYDLTDGATGLVLLSPEKWFDQKASTMRLEAKTVPGKVAGL